MRTLDNIKREAKLLLRETRNWEDKDYEPFTSLTNFSEKLNLVARYKGFKGFSDYLHKTSSKHHSEVSIYDISLDCAWNDEVPELFKLENSNITIPRETKHNQIKFMDKETTNIAKNGMFVYTTDKTYIDSAINQINTHLTIHNDERNWDSALYNSDFKVFVIDNPILKQDSIDPLNPIITANDSLLSEIFGDETSNWLVPILKDFHATGNGIKLFSVKSFFNLKYLKELAPFYPKIKDHFSNIGWDDFSEAPSEIVCINHLNSCVSGLNFAETLRVFKNCFSENPTFKISSSPDMSCYVRLFNAIDAKHTHAGKIATMALLGQVYPSIKDKYETFKLNDSENYCLYPLVVLSGEIQEDIKFLSNRNFGQNLIIYAKNNLQFNRYSISSIVQKFEKFIITRSKVENSNVFIKKVLLKHPKYDIDKIHFVSHYYLDNKIAKKLS